jgi:hypothetical protein|eukprot:COSAG06_NODE_76_length_25790_cov_35.826749_11_plen_140_part_00
MLGGLRSTASTTWADSHMLADMSTGFKRIGRRDASDGNLDPRTDKANETFKRLFKMMDYNRDHSLRDAELKAGLQVLEHAWGAFSELCKRTPPPSRLPPPPPRLPSMSCFLVGPRARSQKKRPVLRALRYVRQGGLPEE